MFQVNAFNEAVNKKIPEPAHPLQTQTTKTKPSGEQVY